MVSALPHLKGLALVLQHLLHKVHQAVAGGLRPDQRASERQAAQPAMQVRRRYRDCLVQVMECWSALSDCTCRRIEWI